MLTLLGISYIVLFIICYLPQIIKMIRTKSVDDLAPNTYWLGLAACLLAMLYLFLSKNIDFVLLGNYSISASLSALTLVLYYKYKR